MPSYSNVNAIWSGSSQSKASKFVGRMPDLFIGGPRGDGSSGGYYKTGYDPGVQGRFGRPAKNIYMWRDDTPAAPTPKPPPPPKPAPKPATVKAKQVTTPTNKYQSQIAKLTKNLSTYKDTINSLKIDFGEQIKNLQSDYAAQTKDLISNYGLQISDLKEGFQTKFTEQEASFVDRLNKQQKGFDVSMANQQIAGKAANLQIGSNQSNAAQQGGTAGFRNRGLQFNTPAYAGLSINSGNINI